MYIRLVEEAMSWRFVDAYFCNAYCCNDFCCYAFCCYAFCCYAVDICCFHCTTFHPDVSQVHPDNSASTTVALYERTPLYTTKTFSPQYTKQKQIIVIA